MCKQKGAALIVVLSLLVGSLIIGLSSMQSSQVDERLAGNQKLITEVQMAAEKAASEGLSRVSEPADGTPGLLQYLLRGGCPIEDLFLPISGDDRNDISWSNLDTKLSGWSSMLNADGEPCASYDGGWIAKRNAALSDQTPYADPDFSGDLYAGLGNDVCTTPIQCVYRYLSVNDNRYIVGLAAYFDDNGGVLAESQPVFVELDINDPPPEIEWLFSAAPISLLTLISDLKIAGANNVTLEGGESDILAQEGNREQLISDFTVSTGNKTFEPEVATIADGDYEVTELMQVVQNLFELSSSTDSVYFAREDTQMKDVPINSGILVVGGNFVWNGQNDFNGTVLVLGPEVDYQGGGTGNLYGSLIHAPITVKEETYDWVESGQYVDFTNVEAFDDVDGDGESLWRYLNSRDEAVTSFDFSGGGGSVIESDEESMMDVRDSYWGTVSNADFITWESD